ncbi:MAG: ATP-binding protein [Pseudomonadota bacterium]
MRDDVEDLIRETATAVRRRDFLWSGGVAAGVCLVLSFLADVPAAAALTVWVASVAGLSLRYFFTDSRVWSRPVQRVVDAELGAREAELATLRLVRGVVATLPDPVLLLDETGRVELANPAAASFFGADAEDRHLSAVLRAPSVLSALEEVREGAPSHSVEFATSGASERHCRAFVAIVGDGDRRRSLLVIRDLTAEKRLERMREDFVASASHELRTPLASMQGFIETLRGNARDDADARERFLQIMQDQAERMGRLINDLMSLSRIELDENVPPTDRVDLGGVVQDVLAGLGPIAKDCDCSFTFDPPAAPLFIVGDRDQVIQVVQNLVDNAMRYAGEAGPIDLRIGFGASPTLFEGASAYRFGDSVEQLSARYNRPTEQIAYVQVRDHGDGVERSALPRLTERFYRVDVQQSRQRGGTGLGLAIVKHVLNRHRGGLHVETAAGAGTAFTAYFAAAEAVEERLAAQ